MNKIIKKYFVLFLSILILFNNSIFKTNAKEINKQNEVDTWVELAELPGPFVEGGSVVYEDKIYVLGGADTTTLENSLNTFYVYDIKTNTWETLDPMPVARAKFNAHLIDGKIYCIGGLKDQTAISDVDIYDIETQKWTKGEPIPESKCNYVSKEIDGTIYVLGGGPDAKPNSITNTIFAYDTKTNSWQKKNNARGGVLLTNQYTPFVEAYNEYLFLGQSSVFKRYDFSIIDIYNTKTETWEEPIYISRATPINFNITDSFEIVPINNTLYFFGGVRYHTPIYPETLIDNTFKYNFETDSWSELTPMPIPMVFFNTVFNDNIIYTIGGEFSNENNSPKNKLFAYYPDEQVISPDETPNEEEIACEEAVQKAEQTRNPEDIEAARDLVNALPESIKKDEFQDRLDALLPNISIENKNSTANFDIYIKSENILSLSLNTNSVTFEDFSGVEDDEELNAITLTVNSSLPYQVNAYLPTEITGSKYGEKMNKEIFNIRANNEGDYKKFSTIETPLILLDNQEAGKNKEHGIDLMLKGNIAHKKDVYKATVKFEVEQK